MNKEYNTDQLAFLGSAIRTHLQLGENGFDMVSMTISYLENGWMDYGQAALMLQTIINSVEENNFQDA